MLVSVEILNGFDDPANEKCDRPGEDDPSEHDPHGSGDHWLGFAGGVNVWVFHLGLV